MSSDDFYQAMKDAMRKEHYTLEYDLKTIMDPWMEHGGLPILTAVRDYDSQSILLKQQQYFSNNETEEKSIVFNNWFIPISIVTSFNPNFTDTTPDIWLRTPSRDMGIGHTAEDWIIFNKQQTGEYK